uniref:Uncharacterized protein n=1 Tax=Marseillevirus sp. TaxID=2809551 RepID=A0AA96EMP5_9VIRU|nr:hypothetical protein MarDSR_503 [Marseillevirus sp.]
MKRKEFLGTQRVEYLERQNRRLSEKLSRKKKRVKELEMFLKEIQKILESS